MSKTILPEINFMKEKATYCDRKLRKASNLLNGPRRNETKAQIKRSSIAKVEVRSQLPRHQRRLSVAGSSFPW